MPVIVRPERADDYQAIYDVTRRAFAPMPFADGDEQFLIGKLRDAGGLSLSLVAEMNGVFVGQVTFSKAFAADGTTGWYALGPVSAEPILQRQGIGSALIRAGIAWLREQNAAGCVLVGNPAYYQRFGFRLFPDLASEREPAEYYQILPLAIEKPATVVAFHPAFYG